MAQEAAQKAEQALKDCEATTREREALAQALLAETKRANDLQAQQQQMINDDEVAKQEVSIQLKDFFSSIGASERDIKHIQEGKMKGKLQLEPIRTKKTKGKARDKSSLSTIQESDDGSMSSVQSTSTFNPHDIVPMSNLPCPNYKPPRGFTHMDGRWVPSHSAHGMKWIPY